MDLSVYTDGGEGNVQGSNSVCMDAEVHRVSSVCVYVWIDDRQFCMCVCM